MKVLIEYINNKPAGFFFWGRLFNSAVFAVIWSVLLLQGGSSGSLLPTGLLASVFLTALSGLIFSRSTFNPSLAKIIIFAEIFLILIFPYEVLNGTAVYLLMPVLLLLTMPFLFNKNDLFQTAALFFSVLTVSSILMGLLLGADHFLLNYFSQLVLFGIILLSSYGGKQFMTLLDEKRKNTAIEKTQLENKNRNLEHQLNVSRQHTEILNKDVRRRDIEIQNILTLSGQLKTRTDSRKVINSFMLTAIGQIGSEHSLILIREKKEHNFLQPYIHRGLRGVDLSRIRIYLDSNLIDILNSVREPLLISQIPREGLYDDEIKLLNQFSNDLICPIFIKNNLSALFIIGRKITNTEFTQEDINMTAIIANQTSFILEQTQMANDYRDFYSKTMRAMLNSLETKYIYAKGHNIRTANYVNLVSQKLGLSSREINDFSYGALMHDIGKVVVPDKYLLNSQVISEEQSKLKEKILEHTIEGSRILKSAGFNQTIVDMALHHHEFHNGKGFPDKMGESDISVGTKILSVCNAYDAMISDRPYRKALSVNDAKENLRNLAGVQFDPEIVKVFLSGLNQAETADTR